MHCPLFPTLRLKQKEWGIDTQDKRCLSLTDGLGMGRQLSLSRCEINYFWEKIHAPCGYSHTGTHVHTPCMANHLGILARPLRSPTTSSGAEAERLPGWGQCGLGGPSPGLVSSWGVGCLGTSTKSLCGHSGVWALRSSSKNSPAWPPRRRGRLPWAGGQTEPQDPRGFSFLCPPVSPHPSLLQFQLCPCGNLAVLTVPCVFPHSLAPTGIQAILVLEH